MFSNYFFPPFFFSLHIYLSFVVCAVKGCSPVMIGKKIEKIRINHTLKHLSAISRPLFELVTLTCTKSSITLMI